MHNSDGAQEAQHPHPPPRASGWQYDVVVVGGGHAGIEAALAAARLGANVALLSFRLDRLGEMSCNPAIGGLGKGQIVREIDALGGAMGELADATGIQFKMLGQSKGAAVYGPRCQSDRVLYREAASTLLHNTAGLTLLEGAAVGLLVVEEHGQRRVRGLRLADGRQLLAGATVLTTGTFLRAIMHVGEEQRPGGRIGEAAAEGLSEDALRLGLQMGRLKTGTPPRLARSSIAWERLQAQAGDPTPSPFSFATRREEFPKLPQIHCHLTYTNERTHAIIRANIQRAPMYAGRIQGVGPRYCPSVEDKVMRFADKERHPIFLEPEGLQNEVIYVNGISTSLPATIQEEFVHTIEGLEQAQFLRHGYAVEYDFVQPSQLADTLAVRSVSGLFLAGQINGTSGYEEAAGQGLLAGANAALWLQGRAACVLARDRAYLGVMVDDLIVSNPSEPYRMFTSRAEYRLLLRQDNADRRLVRWGHAHGLCSDLALQRLTAKEQRLQVALELLGSLRNPAGKTLLEELRRPEVSLAQLARSQPALTHLLADPESCHSLETDVKYAGYVSRAQEDVERMRKREEVEIPAEVNYAELSGLATEAREKLSRFRPRTLGAAARLAGVRPPDVALLSIHLERVRRGKLQATPTTGALAQDNRLDGVE